MFRRTYDNNGGKRARKFIGVMKQCIFAGKPGLKNYSLLERVDSRVQHIGGAIIMAAKLKGDYHTVNKSFFYSILKIPKQHESLH